MKIGDRIYVRGYIDEIRKDTVIVRNDGGYLGAIPSEVITGELPSAQPERLTDDDFETIRIHLNAYKEKLCNQKRWEEAEEYQRIIDRFMAFASAQPEHKTGRWLLDNTDYYRTKFICSVCGESEEVPTTGFGYGTMWGYYPNCGAKMKEGEQE